MSHHHFRHFKASSSPPSKVDLIVAPLCGGGIPLLSGLIMTPIGIYQLAQGVPYKESFGWSFTVIGLLMVIIGAALLVALWPRGETPASEDE